MSQSLPLLYACAGCSHAGRLAYDLAQELDRRGIVEMSCLAGVGALKLHFLKQLRNRERWAIDGCPIQCAKGVFQQAQERVDVHIRLHDFGVRKNSQPTPECSIELLVNEAMEQVASQLPLSVGESAHKGESPIANAPHFAISRSEMASAFKEGPR